MKLQMYANLCKTQYRVETKKKLIIVRKAVGLMATSSDSGKAVSRK